MGLRVSVRVLSLAAVKLCLQCDLLLCELYDLLMLPLDVDDGICQFGASTVQALPTPLAALGSVYAIMVSCRPGPLPDFLIFP